LGIYRGSLRVEPCFTELADFLGSGESHSRVGGDEQPYLLGVEVESVRPGAARAQRTKTVAFDEQLDGQHGHP
jgi:hypothetical protein